MLNTIVNTLKDIFFSEINNFYFNFQEINRLLLIFWQKTQQRKYSPLSDPCEEERIIYSRFSITKNWQHTLRFAVRLVSFNRSFWKLLHKNNMFSLNGENILNKWINRKHFFQIKCLHQEAKGYVEIYLLFHECPCNFRDLSTPYCF